MNGVGIFFIVLIFVVILPAGAWVGYTRWRAHKQGLPPPPLSAYIPFHKSSSSSTYPITPRPGGITGWIQDKVQALKSRGSGSSGVRSGTAYEGTDGSSRGGFAQLDPEGAWDDRVDNDRGGLVAGSGRIGDYEEQELGLHPNSAGPYGGSGYGDRHGRVMPEYDPDEQPRGRSRSRENFSYAAGGGDRGVDGGYAGYDDEEVHHLQAGHQSERANPFGDDAEASELRGVSPRPMEVDGSHEPQTKRGHQAKKGSGDTHASSRKSMFQEGL